jgi:hypothetical protein
MSFGYMRALGRSHLLHNARSVTLLRGKEGCGYSGPDGPLDPFSRPCIKGEQGALKEGLSFILRLNHLFQSNLTTEYYLTCNETGLLHIDSYSIP